MMIVQYSDAQLWDPTVQGTFAPLVVCAMERVESIQGHGFAAAMPRLCSARSPVFLLWRKLRLGFGSYGVLLGGALADR